jgi:hypothetical protein
VLDTVRQKDEFDGERLFRQPRQTSLPACPTILNVIGDLLADGCQIEEFPLNTDIFSLFGKLPIHSRLLPKIVIPGYVVPRKTMNVSYLSVPLARTLIVFRMPASQ